jgi:hypothetical protein
MDALIGNGTRYDLFSHDGKRRVVWRFKDEGVMVEDGAVAIMRSSRWMRIPYSQIASVTLSSAVVGRSATIGQCTLLLEDGRRIVITNGNEQGLADGQRDGPYRLFLRDFHERLVASGDDAAIAFTSGYTAARLNGLVFATIIGTLFFVALPIALLVISRDLKALVITATGALFIWPAWRMIEANRPATYRPDAPPDLID